MSQGHGSGKLDAPGARFGPAEFEALEARRMLSASFEDGVLRIEGSQDADAIIIEAGEFDGMVTVWGVPGVADGTVFSGVDRIRVALGRGDDTFELVGAMRTSDDLPMHVRVFGNAGDDVLRGGNALDELFGGAGDDVLRGGLRRDRLFGGLGNDLLAGGLGDDFLHGGKNADVVRGQRGADLIFGGLGFDRLVGGSGSDTIWGGMGGDVILGGDGADLIHGGAGADLLRGGLGGDRIYGDAGADQLLGGIGHDWLFGGQGEDSLIGGLGRDTLLGAVSEVEDRSEFDALWVDGDGNEVSFDSFSDEFWDALAISSDALRDNTAEDLELELDQLEIALDENAEAYFALLSETLSDAEVQDAAMDAFADVMRQLGEEFDDYLDDLADDLIGDIRDGFDDLFGNLF